MRTNPLLAGLIAVLFLSSLATILRATRHFFAVVELERLQAVTIDVRNTANYAQALANEAIRYSDRDPGIRPVLEQFRTKVAEPGSPAMPEQQ
jgi:hypothetical protein